MTPYLHFKRLFDILASGVLILILSPVYLMVASAIRMESKGPVFYTSKRVGQHYRVFDFYKFRSMRIHADKMLQQVSASNQYGPAAPTPVQAEIPAGGVRLFSDEGWKTETSFLQGQEVEEKKAFIKVVNDPRVTRVGKFIRDTSLDELPQLFNILKGDMSLVGNRPLPLYEAEKLTSDEVVARFLAPAGLTGLWQVTERGQAALNAAARKKLDLDYSRNISFKLDCWILWRTPLALFQRDSM